MKQPPITSLETYPLPYVSTKALAAYLCCDRRTLLRMIDSGDLHAIRVGRNYKIPIEEARRAFPHQGARAAS